MRRRGFTLIEALVVFALLSLVIGGAFLLFRMGTRGFQQAVAKTGAIGDVHRITRALERDVSLTHFYSATARRRDVSLSDGMVRRDGLAVASLSNWGDPDRFEAGTGLPQWDRWSLFYSTTEDKGRMIRLEVERMPPSGPNNFYPIAPMSGLDSFISDSPLNVPDAIRVTTLSNIVRSFEVELDSSTRLVILRLRLFNLGGKRMTSEDKVEDYLESEFEIYPLNSYPEL